MRHVAVVALLAVVVAANAACPASSLGQPRVACEDDSGCAKRDVCVLGTCVDAHDQSLTTVSIEIDPSAAQLPVQDKLGVNLKLEKRVDIALKGGVEWSAVVKHDAAPVAAAELIAQPDTFIPGRILAPTATTDAAGALTLQVVDGGRYHRAVFPTDGTLAPVYLDTTSTGFPASGGPDGTEDLGTIDIPDPVVTVQAVVKAGVDTAAIGVPKLSVALFDVDGKRISAQATTGDDGSFSIALAAPASDVSLVVTATQDNQFYPTVKLDGLDASAPDEHGVVDLGVIDLGDVKAPVPFVAAVTGSDATPVAGATAVVKATVGNGTYTATLLADAGGTVSGQLPPGTYDVVAFGPPGASNAALLVDEGVTVPVQSSAAGGALALHLRARVSVHGVVQDPDGKPLPNAAVTLTRVGAALGSAGDDGTADALLVGTVVSFQATTGADGNYDVAVDPAQYRLSVAPVLGSNAPAFSLLVTVPDAGLAKDVDLPARAVVAGTVVFQGTPVAGAFVRVFTTAPLLDEHGNAILLGSAAAGTDGGFELVVPDLVKAGAP